MRLNELGKITSDNFRTNEEPVETTAGQIPEKFQTESVGSKVSERLFGASLQKNNLFRNLEEIENGQASASSSSKTIKFDSSIGASQKKQINEAFGRILKYGTPLQKEIIRRIQNSNILIAAGSGGSGTTGLIDSIATQQKIDTQRLNEMKH